MEQVYDFLKKAGNYYLATTDGDQPRVRPFGTIHIFEGKLYIQTGKVKNVSKQILINPKIEISAMLNDDWIRIEAVAVEDENLKAKESMLNAYPSLKTIYRANDGNTQVFYLKDVTATIYSFTKEPVTFKF